MENDDENLLKKKHYFFSLYKTNNNRKVSHAPKDIISQVNLQIKSIQNAQFSNINKKPTCDLKSVKKNNFLQFNVLADYIQASDKKVINKFETQCVTDTQLIDVVQDVELAESHKGMTQEFESDFCDSQANINIKENECFNLDQNNKEPVSSCIVLSLEDNNTQHLNESIQLEYNNIGNIIELQAPLSPVLDLKCNLKKKKTLSPLVYNLEEFENFENLVNPILEQSNDMNLVKYKINTQITNKDLSNQSDVGSKICIPNDSIDNKKIKDTKVNSQLQTQVEEDAILFSSDEELDRVHTEYNDLPLTCAFETSFYEKSQILNRTMFVGFQTASNKSIQIKTDSFSRAKSILSDLADEINTNENSITKLVEVCDNKTIIEKHGLTYDNSFKSEMNKNIDVINKFKEKPLLGFRTANDKPIKLSDTALQRCQKVFQDIDLSDKFEDCLVNDTCEGDISDINNIFLDYKTDEEFLQKSTSGANKNKIDNSHTDEMPTFKTASNKKITVSEQALAHSKNIFDGIEDDPNKKNCQGYKNVTTDFSENIFLSNKDNASCSFIGFKTASKKTIKVSSEAIKKSEIIFLDLHTSESNLEKKVKTSVNINNSKIPEIFTTEANIIDKTNYCFNENKENILHYGFQTASNKPVIISKEAFEKTKKVFQDIDKFDSHKITDKKIIKTSSGKLEYNKEDVFHEFFKENATEVDNKLAEVASTASNFSKFTGFQTASNKTVNISAEAIEKSKQIFQDFNEEISEKHNQSVIEISDHENYKKPKLKVSNRITDNFFESEVSLNCAQTFKSEDFNIPTSDKQFQGFQTASYKPVKITAEAIEKSKKLFQDLNDDPSVNHRDIQTVENVDGIKRDFSNFKTPKLNFIDKNTNNIIESNYLLNCQQTFNTEDFKLPPIDLQFKGFQTASKKPVKISAEAIEKSKKLFQDLNHEPSENLKDVQTLKKNDAKERDIHNFKIPKSNVLENKINSTVLNSDIFKNNQKTFNNDCGFQTASNKPVIISKEAFEKTKKVFQDIDKLDADNITDKKIIKTCNKMEYNKEDVFHEFFKENFTVFYYDKLIASTTSNISKFTGFQTASKKQVQISAEAIEKSKKLFQDLNDEISESLEDFKSTKNSDVKTVLENCKTSKSNNLNLKTDDKLIKNINNIDNVKFKNNATHNARSDNFKDSINTNIEINNLLDTQIISDLQETLCTEDFSKHETNKINKRSGSPILSCPRPKRRKCFKTPYSSVIKSKSIENLGTTKSSILVKDKTILKSYKQCKVYKLADMKKLEDDSINEIYLNSNILTMEIDDTLKFQFIGERNNINNGIILINDIKTIFLDSVNKKIVPDGWLDNHLKLIIWKLISYEIRFPKIMQNICNTKNVLEQLNFRYNKELYNVERPALRKIFEKDDASSRTLVLLVAAIYNYDTNNCPNDNPKTIELLLTDGWYCIRATIDKMLTKLVQDEKIKVRTKIVTNGAELVNCDQGIAPWEDTSSVRLKIFGNSTRRARWDARLGYHGNAAILSRLSAVKLDGGKVSKSRVLVARVYPALYIEKFKDGSTVTRSERLENIHQMKHESDRQTIMEKLYEEIEKEISDQESQDSRPSGGKRKSLDNGAAIAKAMRKEQDPSEFRSTLSAAQLNMLEDYSIKKKECLINTMQLRIKDKIDERGMNVERNVVRLVKLRVADFDADGNICKGMLSIWKPNDAIFDIITEGTWIDLLSVVPTSMRYSEIQLSANRQSVFLRSKYKLNEQLQNQMKSLMRKCYHISELCQNPTQFTEFNEIDTVGLVFLIEPADKDFESTRNQPFQNAYLSDSEKNIICVNFWGGMKKFGFEKVLEIGHVVSCANLQKRVGNSLKTIPQYRATEFSYFTKTPKNEHAKLMIEELNLKYITLDKRKYLDDCVLLKNNYFACKNSNINDTMSPYRLNISDYNISKLKTYVDSPLLKNEDLNLTGLDFESTFKQMDTQNISPQLLLRKKRTNEKIARLRMYGNPPPLNSIHIINQSKNASGSFKSPLSTNVQSRLIEDSPTLRLIDESPKTSIDNIIQSSPLMSLNRTYVKRNVNPVKLDFSHNVPEDMSIELVEDFSKEFEYSPPLSLD